MLGNGYEAKMLIHTTYKNDLVCQKNTRVSARPTALGAAYLQQKREDLSTKDRVGVLRYKHYEIITFEFIVRYTIRYKDRIKDKYPISLLLKIHQHQVHDFLASGTTFAKNFKEKVKKKN